MMSCSHENVANWIDNRKKPFRTIFARWVHFQFFENIPEEIPAANCWHVYFAVSAFFMYQSWTTTHVMQKNKHNHEILSSWTIVYKKPRDMHLAMNPSTAKLDTTTPSESCWWLLPSSSLRAESSSDCWAAGARHHSRGRCCWLCLNPLSAASKFERVKSVRPRHPSSQPRHFDFLRMI